MHEIKKLGVAVYHRKGRHIMSYVLKKKKGIVINCTI